MAAAKKCVLTQMSALNGLVKRSVASHLDSHNNLRTLAQADRAFRTAAGLVGRSRRAELVAMLQAAQGLHKSMFVDLIQDGMSLAELSRASTERARDAVMSAANALVQARAASQLPDLLPAGHRGPIMSFEAMRALIKLAFGPRDVALQVQTAMWRLVALPPGLASMVPMRAIHGEMMDREESLGVIRAAHTLLTTDQQGLLSSWQVAYHDNKSARRSLYSALLRQHLAARRAYAQAARTGSVPLVDTLMSNMRRIVRGAMSNYEPYVRSQLLRNALRAAKAAMAAAQRQERRAYAAYRRMQAAFDQLLAAHGFATKGSDHHWIESLMSSGDRAMTRNDVPVLMDLAGVVEKLHRREYFAFIQAQDLSFTQDSIQILDWLLNHDTPSREELRRCVALCDEADRLRAVLDKTDANLKAGMRAAQRYAHQYFGAAAATRIFQFDFEMVGDNIPAFVDAAVQAGFAL